MSVQKNEEALVIAPLSPKMGGSHYFMTEELKIPVSNLVSSEAGKYGSFLIRTEELEGPAVADTTGLPNDLIQEMEPAKDVASYNTKEGPTIESCCKAVFSFSTMKCKIFSPPMSSFSDIFLSRVPNDEEALAIPPLSPKMGSSDGSMLSEDIITQSAPPGPVVTLSSEKGKSEVDRLEESASSLKSSLNRRERTAGTIFDMFLIGKREPGEDVLIEEPAETSDSEAEDTPLELEPSEILRIQEETPLHPEEDELPPPWDTETDQLRREVYKKAYKSPDLLIAWPLTWLLQLVVLSSLHEPAGATAATKYTDTNQVVNPCGQLQPIATGDAISVAVALAGNRNLWYNNSDPNLNVLSPCSPATAAQVPAGAQVTVFRPMVDQLSLFQIYNQTLLTVSSNFPGAASLVVYAGYNSTYDNGTIVSAPRTFSTPAGKVGGLLLVMDFELGKLTNLTWKDDGCTDCGNTSALCIDHNCATDINSCNAANNTDPSMCMTRINVAYSGTDRNSLSFTSWMNVNSVTRYSLSALYFKADQLLQKGEASIIGNSNTVGTGGST